MRLQSLTSYETLKHTMCLLLTHNVSLCDSWCADVKCVFRDALYPYNDTLCVSDETPESHQVTLWPMKK